jgi:hypothetical protein
MRLTSQKEPESYSGLLYSFFLIEGLPQVYVVTSDFSPLPFRYIEVDADRLLKGLNVVEFYADHDEANERVDAVKVKHRAASLIVLSPKGQGICGRLCRAVKRGGR